MSIESERFWENVRFLSVIFALGFVMGELCGSSLSYQLIIMSIVGVWACIYTLAYLISGTLLGGITTLGLVWTNIGLGAICGSMISASQYGVIVVPITVAVAIYAANRYPVFALLLAIMAAGALFTRFGTANSMLDSNFDHVDRKMFPNEEDSIGSEQ